MDGWIAELRYIFWGFSLVRLAKKGYYSIYNVLIVQHSSGKGELGDDSWQTISVQFPYKNISASYIFFPIWNFPWGKFSISDCKYISMALFQYSIFLSPSQREESFELSKITIINETLGLIRTWKKAEFSQHKLFYFKHWLFCTNILSKKSNS